MMNCSIVIPVFRGEATIIPLVERLFMVLRTVAEHYEVILVDDGSPDQSWARIEELTRQYPWVIGVKLMRNYGQENAVLCGIRQARYEIIVTMDDDLQHPPEEIPILISKLNEGYDVVYGTPKKMPHSWWRNMFSVLSKLAVSYIMGFKTLRDISSFRALRASLRNAFDTYHGPDVFVDVLLSWGTSQFTAVEVNEVPREMGQSTYSFGKLVRVALLLLTSYSTMPLRFASILGFVFTIFGFLILAYVVTVYFTAGSIAGFTFISSAVAIFSGIQLFALGVIGEYLAHVFDRQTGRPTYMIKTSIGQNTNDKS